MPFFRHLGFTYYTVARPRIPLENPEKITVSVVVPCKNEEENIAGGREPRSRNRRWNGNHFC